MIIRARCKVCKKILQDNGKEKFDKLMFLHYSSEHKEIVEKLEMLIKNADDKLYLLKKEFPQLYISCGFFKIREEKELYDIIR